MVTDRKATTEDGDFDTGFHFQTLSGILSLSEVNAGMAEWPAYGPE